MYMYATLSIVFAVVVNRGEAGYVYPRPSVAFELPIEKNLNSPPVVGESLNQIHKVAVSYSVPIEDFQYLKQLKNEYNSLNNNQQVNRPFSGQIVGSNEGSQILEKLVVQSDNLFSNVNIGNVGQVSIVNQDYDRAAVIQEEIKQKESVGNNEIVSINRVPIVNQFANNNPVLIQNVVQPQQPAPAPIEPRVTKHIYFHVPPPDVEEPPVYRVPEPPKKIYKIIFVKVPSQQASYNAQVQQIVQAKLNQNAAVEDKTLIYVLVKKPEPVQILPLPPSTPSPHEVLFVKYNENGASGLPVPSDSSQGNILFNSRPLLKRGLKNGQS